jgi:hypothetical protein
VSALEPIRATPAQPMLQLTPEEKAAVTQMQANAEQAGKLIKDLLGKAEGARGQDIIPQLLRAAADVQTKSIDGVSKLTGRDHQAPTENLGQTLAGLASRGLIRMNIDIGPSPEPGE